MSTYGYSGSKAKKNNESSKAPWLMLGVIILFLLWSSFRVALFNAQISEYEHPIYLTALISALLAIFAIAISWKQLKWTSHKDTLSILVFMLPATYALSMINAVSQYLAVNMLLIMFVYGIFFVASSIIAQDGALNRILNLSLMIISYIIVFFGLFHWLGNGPTVTLLVKWLGVPLTDSGAYFNAVMLDSNGARLASVFQYANTYAGFLMAFLLAALFFVGKSRTWWGKSGHALMLVPILLSMLLTLSRGGLLLLPVAFIVVLVFLKPYRQLMWILHLAVSGIITLLILNPVTEIGLAVQNEFSSSASFKGWTYVILGSALSAAVSYVLERWAAPWLENLTSGLSKKKWGTLLIPVGGALLAGTLLFILIGTNAKSMLPENISTRLETINLKQHSVLERITFYKDSIKVLADYPLLGAGGGAWYGLFEKYQDYSYTSRQAHSYFMQYLVETGIVGILILFVFLIYTYWNYIRTYIKSDENKRDSHFLYFIIATSILIHSLMDFNMSYVFIGILVFISIGGMAASIDAKPIKMFKPTSLRITFASILGVVGIGLFITSLLFVQASSAYSNAVQTVRETQDFNKTMVHLKKAMDLRPTHPEYAAFEAHLFFEVYKQQKNDQFFDEAIRVLNKAIPANPYHKQPLLQQLIDGYKIKGMDEQIYTIYSDNAPKFPWDMNWYNEYMDYTVREGYKAFSTAPDKKGKYLDEVIAAYEHVKANVERLKALPKEITPNKEFYMKTQMAMNAGRAYFMKGEPGQAAEAMKPYLQEDVTDPNNKDLARWYVAATIQQGQIDQAWYDKLIAVSPDEKAQIDQIAELKFKAE